MFHGAGSNPAGVDSLFVLIDRPSIIDLICLASSSDNPLLGMLRSALFCLVRGVRGLPIRLQNEHHTVEMVCVHAATRANRAMEFETRVCVSFLASLGCL
jgi:hypothetical protein